MVCVSHGFVEMHSMTRTPNCTCKVCGKAIYRRPKELMLSRGNAYCSQGCFGRASQVFAECPICGRQYVAERNRKTCSRACANTNRAGRRYNDRGLPSRDRAQDVRAIKKQLIDTRGAHCQRCGFSDVNILEVQHIVRRSDGGTNDLENLELVCPNCHASIHFYEVKHNKKGIARS